MAKDWEEIGSGGDYPDTLEFQEGDEVIGVYLNKRTHVGPNESAVYEIATKEGLYSVWGSTILNERMGKVSPGVLVRIKFLGWGESERSGRTWKDWKVEARSLEEGEIEEYSIDEEESAGTEDVDPDSVPF